MIKIILYWFYIWNCIILQSSSTYFKWSELMTWVSVHATRGLFECLDIQLLPLEIYSERQYLSKYDITAQSQYLS